MWSSVADALTADDLEAAPEYETLAMKQAREDAERDEALRQSETGAQQPLGQGTGLTTNWLPS